MNFKDLHNATNLNELKKAYKKYALRFHPDNKETGCNDTFISLQNEYEQLFERLKHVSNDKNEKTENVKTYRDIINQIIKFNVTIEIVGSWIWVSGSTYPIKDKLKKLGFKWSKNKKAWYYTSTPYKKKSKKKTTMSDIKQYYGYETVKKQASLTHK